MFPSYFCADTLNVSGVHKWFYIMQNACSSLAIRQN